ncbi:protein kinase [candidate division KSB1 bacterium]|nr:protein kinase [candidate division KSB1 bacterium]
MDIFSKTSFQRYKFMQVLGHGGMAVVYKAFDQQLQRAVAIKVLSSELYHDEKNMQRFLQEARAVSALVHPHICLIYDAGRIDSIPYIVMEYIDGNTLRRLMQEKRCFSISEITRICQALCSALEAIHDIGVIHRDIKPGNIMIDKSGTVKLMDFGLVKLKSGDDATMPFISDQKKPVSLLTSVGSLMGTVSCMSPEQIENKVVDERSDIFSLGILLYELAYGKPPFAGKDRTAVMQSILNDSPQFSGYSPAKRNLNRALTKALQKKPQDRFQNVGRLSRALTRLSVGRNVFWASLSAILLLLVLVFALKPVPVADLPQVKISPVLLSEDIVYSMALSPDDKKIVYQCLQPGKGDSTEVAILDLKSGKINKILTDRRLPDSGVTWSPTGAEVALTRVDSIYAIDIFDSSGTLQKRLPYWGFCLSWFSDGRRLVYSSSKSFPANQPSTLNIINLVNDSVRTVLKDSISSFCYADFASDQKWLVTTGGQGSICDLWLYELESGKRVQLTDDGLWYKQPRFADGDKSLFFLSTKNGSFDIYRAGINWRKKKIEETIAVTNGFDVSDYDVSADGKTLYFIKNESREHVCKTPLSDELDFDHYTPLFYNAGIAENMAVSPDGEKMILETLYGGIRTLMVRELPNGTARTLVKNAFSPSWSPDSKWIAYDADGGDQADIWRISVNGGKAERLVDNPTADFMPHYSHDGGYISFLSDRSGEIRLWLLDMVSHEERQITDVMPPASSGFWANNSLRLAFFGDNRDNKLPNRYDLILYDLMTRDVTTVKCLYLSSSFFVRLLWNCDDTALYIRLCNLGPFIKYDIESAAVRCLDWINYPKDYPSNTPLDIQANDLYFIRGEQNMNIWKAELLENDSNES